MSPPNVTVEAILAGAGAVVTPWAPEKAMPLPKIDFACGAAAVAAAVGCAGIEVGNDNGGRGGVCGPAVEF